MNLAAIDCAAEESRKICTDYKIRGFPSIKVSGFIYDIYVLVCFIWSLSPIMAVIV